MEGKRNNVACGAILALPSKVLTCRVGPQMPWQHVLMVSLFL